MKNNLPGFNTYTKMVLDINKNNPLSPYDFDSKRRNIMKFMVVTPVFLLIKPTKSHAALPALIAAIAELIRAVNEWRETTHKLEGRYVKVAELTDGNELYVDLNRCIDCGACESGIESEDAEDAIDSCPALAFYELRK